MTPDKFTIREIYLDVGDNHEIYVQDWGNKSVKKPIIFLHGGPGSECKDKYKKGFDPKSQRVIFFDQRGSGRSLPKGSLDNNTTEKMVEDIEKIIKNLGLQKVILTGGSWGSTLALAFAVKYPKRVIALVISGVFTARKSEIEYLDKGGFKTFFPNLWDEYVKSVPKENRDDPSTYHYKNVFGNDGEKAKRSAYAYSELLEGPLLSLDDRFTPRTYEDFDDSAIRIEMYYLINNCFIPENYIFDNANKLSMPIYLVQGRYDMVCPPITAYELDKLLPNSKLIWTLSGHAPEHEVSNINKSLLSLLSS